MTVLMYIWKNPYITLERPALKIGSLPDVEMEYISYRIPSCSVHGDAEDMQRTADHSGAHSPVAVSKY